MRKLTICGGGNAAHTLIALAGAGNWQVDVYAPHGDEAQRLRDAQPAGDGLIARFADGRRVRGAARRVSGDPAEVIPGSQIILLALPAFAHGATLSQIAAHLDDGAMIGVLPARSGFEYVARDLFPSSKLPYTFFGLQTLPWACRIVTYGREVDILGTKAVVDIASWPTGRAPDLARQLRPLFDVDLRPVASFLTLTLANTGQLIHPGIMYGLCAGCDDITYEDGDAPLFYQGVDDRTAGLLQAMSDEVQALASRLERHIPAFDAAEVVPLHQWLLRAYPQDIGDGKTLRAAFNSNRAYAGLRLPVRRLHGSALAVDFSARYLSEDVPYGLVVLRGIAQLACVPTPVIDDVITWAQDRLGHCYLRDGDLCGPDLVHTRAPQAYGMNTISDLFDWDTPVRAAKESA